MVGIIEFSWAITGLVILPIVGVMMVQNGWQAPLRVFAVLSLAVAPLPFLLPRRHRQPLAPVQRSFRQMAGAVWRTPSARAAIIVNGLIFVAAESFFVTYGAWLEQSFGMAPNQIGRVAALLGLAELTASGASSLFIDRLGKRRGVGIGLAAMTGTLALLPLLERNLALAVAGMAAFTLAFEWSIVSNISLLSEQAPLARGTVHVAGGGSQRPDPHRQRLRGRGAVRAARHAGHGAVWRGRLGRGALGVAALGAGAGRRA